MHKCKEHLHHTSGTEGASSISPGLKSHCSTTLGQISEQPLLTARHSHVPKAAVPQAPSHCHSRGKQCLKWGAEQLQNQILSAAKKIKLFFWKHSIFPLSPTSSNESSSKPPEKSAWSPQRLYGSQPRCQPHNALPSFWSYWSSDLISPLLICDSRKGQARISLAGNKQLLPPAWPKSPG